MRFSEAIVEHKLPINTMFVNSTFKDAPAGQNISNKKLSSIVYNLEKGILDWNLKTAYLVDDDLKNSSGEFWHACKPTFKYMSTRYPYIGQYKAGTIYGANGQFFYACWWGAKNNSLKFVDLNTNVVHDILPNKPITHALNVHVQLDCLEILS